MKGKIIVISGPGGVGKGTIIKALVNRNKNFAFAISVTTRAKRENEIEGYDYYFVTKDKFFKMIENDEFIEYNEFYNDIYYGTLKSELERITSEGKNIIFDIDINGATNIKKLYPEAITFFIVAPSMEELERRLTERGKDSQEIINERMKKATKEMTHKDEYNHIIMNEDLDIAVKEIEKTIETYQ